MKKCIHAPITILTVVCLGVAGCSSAPKNVEMLEQARIDYNEVAQDVTVAKHAPDVLDDARDALESADTRWKQKDHQWRVEHFAYLASKRIETAKLISESKETDLKIQQMVVERGNLTLKMREAELTKARQETLDLKRQVAAIQAEQTERGMVLTLGDVLFDVNQASLAPGAARNIAKIAAFMRNYPDRKAVIEGHTDSVGESQYNMSLSRERAISVRDALSDAGIKASRMSTQGFGETLPVASNTSAAGRQGNRRVEIIFPDASTQVSEFDDY